MKADCRGQPMQSAFLFAQRECNPTGASSQCALTRIALGMLHAFFPSFSKMPLPDGFLEKRTELVRKAEQEITVCFGIPLFAPSGGRCAVLQVASLVEHVVKFGADSSPFLFQKAVGNTQVPHMFVGVHVGHVKCPNRNATFFYFRRKLKQ